jgi:hypothetical protein
MNVESLKSKLLRKASKHCSRCAYLFSFYRWRTQPLAQGAKLEIESVLRETCDRVLEDPTVPAWKQELRAVALQIMGEAFTSVRKEGDERDTENEYVKIETKASRERDSRRTSKQ